MLKWIVTRDVRNGKTLNKNKHFRIIDNKSCQLDEGII